MHKGEEIWLPAGALKEHSGARIGSAQFTAALSEIGWLPEEIDVREPSSRADRPNAQRFHRNFYVGKD